MPSTLLSSSAALADQHDVALLDLDGVVYVGPAAVPGAPEALSSARAAGMRLAFVTNNAARPPYTVADHLSDLGIPAEASEVITSSQAAARYLADRLPGGARVLVVGTTGLNVALEERGLTPVHDAEGRVDAVVQGHSPDMDWRQLAEGAIAINSGVLWVATNVDPTVPSPRGPLPGNGSMVQAMRTATRREPVVTGKPDPTMHRETMLRSNAERPIVVGDRLDTDIEGANAVGCPSLLVFSGVTTVADLLAAPAQHRPSYLGADVAALLTAHTAPERAANGWQCGRWLARCPAAGELVLEPIEGRGEDAAATGSPASPGQTLTEDDLDAVRALCAASWADDTGAGPAGDPTRPTVTAADGAEQASALLAKLGLSG